MPPATPRHHLHLWRPETVAHNLSYRGRGSVAKGQWATAGGVLRSVRDDDIVWTVTLRDGHLFLVGRLVAAAAPTTRAAAARRGRCKPSDLWNSSCWVLAKPGSIQPMREVNLTPIARGLRFDSRRDRLTVNHGRVDGRQLQMRRVLTPSTAALLERVWARGRRMVR
jgi:hypothetical protein